MDIKIQVWLLDIQQSIEEIFLFLGEERNFITYQGDLKTKKAVERNLEIIGEAVNRISRPILLYRLKMPRALLVPEIG